MSHQEIDRESVTIRNVSFTHKEINTVVDAFYSRVQCDPILKAPFQSVHDWPEHIRRLTQFWWIRFGGTPYMFSQYNPVAKHFQAGFNDAFLSRWLTLFHEVIKEHLSEDQSAIWALVSQRMGEALSIKNEMYGQAYERG